MADAQLGRIREQFTRQADAYAEMSQTRDQRPGWRSSAATAACASATAPRCTCCGGATEMAGTVRAGVVVFLLTMLSCYSNYFGTLTISAALPESPQLSREIAGAVEEVAAQFGFVREPESVGSEILAFMKRGRTRGFGKQDTTGADARIFLFVDLQSRPLAISLHDVDNAEETEFVRELKAALERRLRECPGVEGVIFERKWHELARAG